MSQCLKPYKNSLIRKEGCVTNSDVEKSLRKDFGSRSQRIIISRFIEYNEYTSVWQEESIRFLHVRDNVEMRVLALWRSLSDKGYYLEQNLIPCMKCKSCLVNRSKDRAIGIASEMMCHKQNCVITLTYSDKYLDVEASERKKKTIWRLEKRLSKLNTMKRMIPSKRNYAKSRIRLINGLLDACSRIPNVLVRRHADLFTKSLRKYIMRSSGKKVKVTYAGEYGGKTGRAHFHFIILGWSPPKHELLKGKKHYTHSKIHKLWGKGIIDIDPLPGVAAAKYVANYLEKKYSSINEGYKAPIFGGSRCLGYQYMSDNIAEVIRTGKFTLPTVDPKTGHVKVTKEKLTRNFIKWIKARLALDDIQKIPERIQKHITELQQYFKQMKELSAISLKEFTFSKLREMRVFWSLRSINNIDRRPLERQYDLNRGRQCFTTQYMTENYVPLAS